MGQATSLDPDRPTILFDGVCNLCNGFINFIIDRDRKEVFAFGTLQSPSAQSLLIKDAAQDSVVLIDQGEVYFRSKAVLRIASILGFPWNVFSVFRLFPSSFLDQIYDWVARNRYRWFGKRKSCRIPTPSIRKRFLDS